MPVTYRETDNTHILTLSVKHAAQGDQYFSELYCEVFQSNQT